VQQLYTHLIAYAPNNQPPSPFLLLSRTHASLSSACVYTHTRVYTHVCVCVCVCIHTCLRKHTYRYALAHSHAHCPSPSLSNSLPLSFSPSLLPLHLPQPDAPNTSRYVSTHINTCPRSTAVSLADTDKGNDARDTDKANHSHTRRAGG
jgi:hypothetical protein